MVRNVNCARKLYDLHDLCNGNDLDKEITSDVLTIWYKMRLCLHRIFDLCIY